jgi:hypothetical protein
LFLTTACFTGCDDETILPETIIVPDAAALTQDVYADQTQGASEVSFVTTGAWTSSISTETARSTKSSQTKASSTSTGWISISPDHGDEAGNYTVAVNLEPNYTGEDRTAVITVACEGKEITITVTQKATKEDGTTPDPGDATSLLGTWNLKMIEGVKIFTGKGGNGNEYTGTFVTKRAGAFTLNEDGSFTGEIEILTNEANNNGDNVKTWSYAGGSFTLVDNGFTITYKATVTSSELVFEYGTPNTNGYAKATYTKDAVTVPPLPDQITNLYTGSASIFYGVWALTKSEDNYSDSDGTTWWAISFNASAEVMKLTVNNDGTFQMVDNTENHTSTGTWSFANSTLTIIESGKQSDMNVEAGSSASTLIWSEIDVKGTEKTYSRMTWTKR